MTLIPRCIAFFADQGIDDLDLAFGARRRGAGVDHFDAADLLGRFVGAGVGGVKKAVAEAFHDHRDARLLRAGLFSLLVAAGCQGGQRADGGDGYEEFFDFQCDISVWNRAADCRSYCGLK
jgi:hypothetical protein